MQKTAKIKIPPQHLESEMALLGAIMIRPENIHEIIDVISAESFYADKHKIIYKAMLELLSRGQPIDLLSLSSKLEENKTLDSVGGRSYLAEMIQSVPTATNAVHYAQIVQKKYMLRRLIEAAEKIHDLGFDEVSDIDETLDKAEKKVYEITNSAGNHKFVEIKETLGEAWDRIEKLHESTGELRGVPSGFTALDNMLSGFQKSDLIILAARPSMGKTSLALDIARQAATKHNIPVGFFSLEMSSAQLVDRMLASESKVNAWRLRTGKLSRDEDFGRIRDALDKLSNAPIFIDDQPGNNILKMRAVARRLKSEKGLGLIIVDYLQLIIPTNNRNSDNVVQQVTEISRSLKQLARELEVPVIALSQLSRAVEQRGGDGRPKLSDLRDSGSIEQDADVVMFIHREDKYKENSDKQNIAQIHIEKHRNGAVGSVELFFDSERVTFLNLEKSNIGDFTKDDEGGF